MTAASTSGGTRWRALRSTCARSATLAFVHGLELGKAGCRAQRALATALLTAATSLLALRYSFPGLPEGAAADHTRSAHSAMSADMKCTSCIRTAIERLCRE
jgi:hypothetical protein